MRKEPLFLRHFLDRQPFSRAGNEMPIGPFGIFKIENALSFFLGRQCVQIIVRGGCHLCGSFVRTQWRADSEEEEAEGNYENRFHHRHPELSRGVMASPQ